MVWLSLVSSQQLSVWTRGFTFSCSSRSLTTPSRWSMFTWPLSAIVNPSAQQEYVVFFSWPQNKAQGLLWVLKKCLWMQQQRFLRPVLLVFIKEAVIVILTFGSDTISHAHFKISAWFFQKISTDLIFPRLANIPGSLWLRHAPSVRRSNVSNNAGSTGQNVQNKRRHGYVFFFSKIGRYKHLIKPVD